MDVCRICQTASNSLFVSWLLSKLIEGTFGGRETISYGMFCLGTLAFLPVYWLISKKKIHTGWLLVNIFGYFILFMVLDSVYNSLSHLSFIWFSTLGIWFTIIIITVILFHNVRLKRINKQHKIAAYCNFSVLTIIGSFFLLTLIFLYAMFYDYQYTHFIIYLLSSIFINSFLWSKEYISFLTKKMIKTTMVAPSTIFNRKT